MKKPMASFDENSSPLYTFGEIMLKLIFEFSLMAVIAYVFVLAYIGFMGIE